MYDERLLEAWLFPPSNGGLCDLDNGSEMGADDAKLGGLVRDCEMDEDLLLSVSRLDVSLMGSTDLVLESDKGRKKDIVRDRFKAGFSSLSTVSSE